MVRISVRHRNRSGEWSKLIHTIAVVDPAQSISTAPPQIAEALGFVQPIVGPRRRIETGAGAVDYFMGEVELRIAGMPDLVLRPSFGFGGTRQYIHLGYAKVLQHFCAEFRPYEGTFSLKYVPPETSEE